MRLLITGAGGLLGAYLLRSLESPDGVIAWGGPSGGERSGFALAAIDLTDFRAVADAFRAVRPDVVLHAAALARVADCCRNPELAMRVNGEATAFLAGLCTEAGGRLVLVSTDLVFSGHGAPYKEDDSPDPVSVYGRSKRAAEEAALAIPRSAVVRVSLLYGPALHGRPSFFDEQTHALRAGRAITLFRDEWRTPLDLVTAARALLEVARSEFSGILHVGGPQRLSRLEMGLHLARLLAVDPTPIVAADRDAMPAAEPRPRDVSLDSSRWRGAFPGSPRLTMEDAFRQFSVVK
jgi:dTDP-4-dehydrorhamnose reductase